MSKLKGAGWGIPEGELRSAIQTLIPQTADRVPWGIDRSGATFLAPIKRPRKIRVGILDTGIDSDHPDLAGLTARRVDLTKSASGPTDRNGHGTHVAGTIAALRNDNGGLIGMADEVELYSYKVLNDRGEGTDAAITQGLSMAIQDDCDVINVSLGGIGPMPSFHELMKTAILDNILVVCAAGNSGNNEQAIYPARYPEAVCVGSYDIRGRISSFSQRSNLLDFAAPGEGIESCYPGGRYTVMSGTSMAAPHVTGAIAIVQRRLMTTNDRPPYEAVLRALADSAKPRPDNGDPQLWGKGSLYLTSKYTTEPDSEPEPNPTPEPGKKPIIVEIPIMGINRDLDEALIRSGVTSAMLRFVIGRQ